MAYVSLSLRIMEIIAKYVLKQSLSPPRHAEVRSHTSLIYGCIIIFSLYLWYISMNTSYSFEHRNPH